MWSIWRRLTARRSERDFRAEVEAHLELEAYDLATQRGLPPDEARFAARRRFGNVTAAQERWFERGRWLWLDRLGQHVRYALRGMRRQPGSTTAIVATLAVGIGLNTAIFTLLYSFFLRPLPVRDAGRVVNVYQAFSGEGSRHVNGETSMLSWVEFRAYAAGTPAFAGAAAYRDIDLSSPIAPGTPLRAQVVSCEYFAALQVRLVRGRGFLPDECAPAGDPAVVVLSHAMWTARFGGDSAIVGRTVSLNNLPFTVVGVAEPGFAGIMPQAAELWMPVPMHLALSHGRDSTLVDPNISWLMMAGRLRPDASADQARAELQVVARRLDAEVPGLTRTASVTPGALINYPEVRSKGGVAFALVGVLSTLLIAMACANVMNLLLARGIARRREIGIRLAVGASRARLVEQLLVESVMLALAGAAAGMLLVLTLPPLARALLPIPGLQADTSPDVRVLTYAAALALGTALLFGVAPALETTRLDLVSAFKGGLTLGRAQIRPSRLRSVAVGVQVALSALLLVTATLLLRAVDHAAGIHPGFETRNVIGVSFNLDALGYDSARAGIVLDALRARVAAAPGVIAAGLGERLPLLGRHNEDVSTAPPSDRTANRLTYDVAYVSADYFAAMGIPLVRGRPWRDDEARAPSDRPAILTASLARRLWPDDDPLGRRFYTSGRSYVVTGIAAEARFVSLDRAETPFAYLAASQPLGMLLIARTRGPSAGLAASIPEWARAVDPNLVARSERLEDRLRLVLMPSRIAAAGAGVLGMLALVLAVVGIAGVVGYGVSQRRREVAVRLALGATGRGVVALMMRQGARPIVIGLAVGLALAAGAAQALRGLLFGLRPVDPLAYVAAALGLLAISLGATWVPSRRAAGVDPATVLREE